ARLLRFGVPCSIFGLLSAIILVVGYAALGKKGDKEIKKIRRFFLNIPTSPSFPNLPSYTS
ncbi:hypothetical protein L0156_02840, partial [bacterium]|nr:hypothetical protein [bacterium]